MNPTLTVIIPTLNRPLHLRKCLESLRAQSLKPTECMIVDQSDDDATQKLFESTDLECIKKIYVRQKVKSLIAARNNGLKNASNSDFLSFIDDDVQLFPDFFAKLLMPFQEPGGEDYAGGMGTFECVISKRDLFTRFFFLPGPGDGRFLPNGMPTFAHWKKEFSVVEFVSGGITVFRTPIIKEYGYDDRILYYGHGDDADVSYRISRKYKLFCQPLARCSHDVGAPGRDPGAICRSHTFQNYYYLLQKNVGTSFLSVSTYAFYVIGQTLQDFFSLKRSAFIGDLQGIAKLLFGKIDSIKDYAQFKASLKRTSFEK